MTGSATDTAKGTHGVRDEARSPARLVWAIAVPAMLTNLATALFGLADMWVIGRLGDASAQGAVELGAKFMLAMLNVFNFLRMSTVALTAQAAGRGDATGQSAALARALGVALAIGAVLALAMPIAIPFGLDVLGAAGPVRQDALGYIGVRYWSGPLWLVNAVLIGWLIGKRQVRTVLVVEVCANLVHIALDLGFVLGLGWGVEGVAFATLLSEGMKSALLAALVFAQPEARRTLSIWPEAATWRREAMLRMFALNRDLFVRTLLLTGAITVFARMGAQQGAVQLAANGILFQLFMLSALVLDGFENAAQVLCGEAQGARNRTLFVRYVRAALIGGGLGGLGIALLYLAGGRAIAGSFSTDPAVVAATFAFVGWAIAMPLAGFASYVFDGVFVGAGWTRAMLGTMAAALAVYALLLWALDDLGNTGLWIAFTAFILARGTFQALVLPRLLRREFDGA